MKFVLGIFLFLIAVPQVMAQQHDRPWFFGIGVNAVDYKTHQPTDLSIHYTAIRISAGRTIWGNFSAELSYAMNEVQNFAGVEGKDLGHSALDLSLLYNLGPHLYDGRKGLLDPYAGVGTGWTRLERSENKYLNIQTLNAIAGINFWVTPRLAIVTQYSYKHSSDDFVDTYFEYVLGIRYTFSLKSDPTCFP